MTLASYYSLIQAIVIVFRIANIGVGCCPPPPLPAPPIQKPIYLPSPTFYFSFNIYIFLYIINNYFYTTLIRLYIDNINVIKINK